MFRNKVQVLVKVEALTPLVCTNTERCPQEIINRLSIHNRITGATNGHLTQTSCPMLRSYLLDLPSTDRRDTLILALEVVLKIAARPPRFKVRFRHEQPPASVTPL